MEITKQPMPAHVEAMLSEFVSDIRGYLDLEECEEFAADDLTLAGYYGAGPKVAFVVYEYISDGERAIAAIQLNPQSKSFHDACVFSWGREESQTIEDALQEFSGNEPAGLITDRFEWTRPTLSAG